MQDHMCAMLILPHFSEATSDVSQPSEGAGEAAETSTEAAPGESAAGDETSSRAAAASGAGLGRCMPGQVRMGPLLAWGVYGLVGGFLSIQTALM